MERDLIPIKDSIVISPEEFKEYQRRMYEFGWRRNNQGVLSMPADEFIQRKERQGFSENLARRRTNNNNQGF